MSELRRIELLGRVQVIAPQQEVQRRFRSRKTVLLMAYLACAPHQQHNRETICEILWPETDLLVQRNRLRYEVCQLRKVLGAENLLSLGHQDLRLKPGLLTDVAEFERAAECALRLRGLTERQSALEQALGLYQGPFLPGHFDDWIVNKRHQLGAIYQTLIARLLSDLRELGDEHSYHYWKIRQESAFAV